MQKAHVKVAVTGAAGQIGYALLFRIASGQMFGADTEIDLHLLELEGSLAALAGTAMELEDGAFPLLRRIVCTSDVRTAMSDVNWAILVGSVPRKANMNRSELLQVNGGIFRCQGQAINDYAADDIRVLVVGNPCNSNCLITMQHAPGRPRDRFYAMTLLDQNRAISQLAKKAGVAITEVSQLAIWGNHSSTQYPDFYHATIAGQPAIVVIRDETWLQQTFIPLVQERGAAIIKARGASSAASAANAIISSVYHLTHDTPEGTDFSVAVCSEGEYDVDPGLIFSYPCRVNQGRLNVVKRRQHNAFAQEKLRLTLSELRAEHDAIKQLGLID